MPSRTRNARQLVLAVAARSEELNMIESVLKTHVEVELARTEEAALVALRQRRIDALVATCEIAGIDGLGFLREASSTQSGVGRVLIAPRRQLAKILPALREGVATSFVLEPFTPEELWVAVSRALRTQPPRLMVVTQDPAFRDRIEPLLLGSGIDCSVIETSEEALRRLGGASWDVALVDVDLGGQSGLDLLGEIRTRATEIRVLLCGEYELPQFASDVRRIGAFDYVAKPAPDEQLLSRLQSAYEDKSWAEQSRVITTADANLNPIVGSGAAMERVRSMVATVAQSTAPVLIRGDTGTGKELAARHIHALSPRRKGRFFAVNCAALTESLFESEMFGHERGAFTGATSQKAGMCELANDGTLLLDEIGELAPLSQAKLLRFLQSGEFIRVGGQRVQRSEARVLAATNAPLEQMIQDGRFRADLFYRLNVLELRLPSLQEHREDLPVLISHLMAQLAHKHGRPSLRLAPRAFEQLLGHTWTGNVRELQGVLERSVLMAQGLVIDDVQLGQPSPPTDEGTPFAVDLDRPLREVVDTATRLVEKNYLMRLLAACGGHVIAASKRASIDRRNLYRKLRDYEIDPDTFRQGRGSKR